MDISILTKRRSIRQYKQAQISDQELNSILEAGIYAPTGMNRQTPLVVAVQNPEIIRQMEQENARVMGTPDGHPFYGAPTVVVVFADGDAKTGFEDACLVMGNLLNGAYAVGVGSCWIHRAREVFDTELGKQLKKEWGIPDSYYGVGNCILGYWETEPEARPRKEGYFKIIK